MRLALGLIVLGAIAGAWELLAAQVPPSPLHFGVLPGPVGTLRETAFTLGLLMVAAAWLAPLASPPPGRLLVAIHVGVALTVGARLYGAATGLVGHQLVDPRWDAQVAVVVRTLGELTLLVCALIFAARVLRPSPVAPAEKRAKKRGPMGEVVSIYVRPAKREPVEARERVVAVAGVGLEGDHKQGGKRQVTLLSREAWQAACAEVGAELDPGVRRANLVVSGVALEQTVGARLRLGEVVVEVLGETDPCDRMEEAHPGLRGALEPDVRGGVFGRIERGGEIAVGEAVEVVEVVG